MSADNAKSERLYVRLTPALRERLTQLMYSEGLPSLSAAGREAIRFYLETRADQLGSRRHFARSLQTRIDDLETFIHLHLALQTYLIAHFSARQLSLLENRAGGAGRVWKGSELLAEAVRIAMQQQPALRLTIEKLRAAATQPTQDDQSTGE